MIRVLSIEDEPDLQRLRALALADEDFELHYAFNGPQGLEKALLLAPDVILCDLMLPGYDGRELIARLKEDPATREIPIIVITGYYDTDAYGETEIRRLGVFDYRPKPLPRDEMIALIRLAAAGAADASRPR
ncbi:MAG: response regulator [Elusimicrobia bacterium]|nr:response regulator [Elusimicrobiota bacterium]